MELKENSFDFDYSDNNNNIYNNLNEYKINENINFNQKYNEIKIIPKENNINIKPIKKEKKQKIFFNSIINPRLPEGYIDLSYDNINNK